ncbi:MAG: hypothetical protein ACREJQ_08180 [bacterium]
MPKKTEVFLEVRGHQLFDVYLHLLDGITVGEQQRGRDALIALAGRYYGPQDPQYADLTGSNGLYMLHWYYRLDPPFEAELDAPVNARHAAIEVGWCRWTKYPCLVIHVTQYSSSSDLQYDQEKSRYEVPELTRILRRLGIKFDASLTDVKGDLDGTLFREYSSEDFGYGGIWTRTIAYDGEVHFSGVPHGHHDIRLGFPFLGGGLDDVTVILSGSTHSANDAVRICDRLHAALLREYGDPKYDYIGRSARTVVWGNGARSTELILSIGHSPRCVLHFSSSP